MKQKKELVNNSNDLIQRIENIFYNQEEYNYDDSKKELENKLNNKKHEKIQIIQYKN